MPFSQNRFSVVTICNLEEKYKIRWNKGQGKICRNVREKDPLRLVLNPT